jgi:hypothetical protein
MLFLHLTSPISNMANFAIIPPPGINNNLETGLVLDDITLGQCKSKERSFTG